MKCDKIEDLHTIDFQLSYHEVLFAYLNETSPVDIGKEHRDAANRIMFNHVVAYCTKTPHEIDGEQFLLDLYKC